MLPIHSSETQRKIERKLRAELASTHLEVVDETAKHYGHAGAASGGGHFIVLVVSDRFTGVGLLDRNRMVHAALKEEIGAEIHALVIRALTPAEWAGRTG
jgi:BolA protein